VSSATESFISSRAADWIAFRRDLHRHPELGFTEFRTIARIAERLAPLGYRLRLGAEVIRREAMRGVPPAETIAQCRARALAEGASPHYVARMGEGMTGLVAELSRGPGPVVAMRFDVDALPIHEATRETHLPAKQGFASARPGAMHACGHDGHAAIGIALAEIAAQPHTEWSGTLRLIFQPAEEGGRGGHAMTERGIVDDVDRLFALHLGCDLPSGRVAASATDMLFSTKWDATFHGRAAHAAANPERGQNAILAAAQAVTALYAIARHGHAPTHVNVGRMEGGTGRNVIADRARLEIEVRGLDDDSLAHMDTRARAAVEGAALMQGCTVDLVEVTRTVGATTSPGARGIVAASAAALPGIDVVESWPLGGCDDAAFLMRRVQERGGEAAYLIVGSDLAAGHHATSFDFSEGALLVAARLMAEVLQRASATRKLSIG